MNCLSRNIFFWFLLWMAAQYGSLSINAYAANLSNSYVTRPASNGNNDTVIRLTDTRATAEEQPSSGKSFKDEEKAFVSSVNSLLRQILPYIMKSSSAELSPGCMSAAMKVFVGIRKLKGWTLRMLDSIGKPAAGILAGTYYSMGNYDQCLDISVSKRGEVARNKSEEMFHGKYCVIRVKQNPVITETAKAYHRGETEGQDLGRLKEMIEAAPFSDNIPNYMSHSVGICIPSVCTEKDIDEVLKSLPFPGKAALEKCEEKVERHLDNGQKLAVAIFVLLGAIVAIGTTVDRFTEIYLGKNYEHMISRKFMSVVISFSLFSNTRKLLHKISNDSIERPDCRSIRGLTFGAVVCIIIYHTYFPPYSAFFKQASHLANFRNYLDQSHFAVTVCLPLALETLFMGYGFLLSNKLWKSTWKKGKTNVNVIRLLVSNYVRLVVPVMFCLGIVVILPLFGHGPFWNDTFEPIITNCNGSWWSLLGMFTNFLDVKRQCLPHFWLPSCLMQITLVSALALWVMARWPRIGVCAVLLLICCSNAAVGILTFHYNLPPTYVAYFAGSETSYFWKISYALPLSHFGSFAVGMLLGVFMARRTHFRAKSFLPVVGWITSAALMIGVCVFVVHVYRGENSMDAVSAGAYAAFHRTLYGTAAAWIVFSCAYGFGSSINSVLAWSVLDPLYKLSYYAYLLHLIIIALTIGISREKISYSHSEMVIRCIAYVFLSYAAAYVCHILTEMPLKSVCTALFRTRSNEVSITKVQVQAVGNGRNGFGSVCDRHQNTSGQNGAVASSPVNGYRNPDLPRK